MGADVLSVECLLIRLHVRTLGVHGVCLLRSNNNRHRQRREIMPLCPPPSSPPNAFFCGPLTLLCDGSAALQPLSVCQFFVSAVTNPELTTWLCLKGEGRITHMSRSSHQTFDAPLQARLCDSVLPLMRLLERVVFALILVLLCLRAVALPILLPAFHPLDVASAVTILRLWAFAARSDLLDYEFGNEPLVQLCTLAVVGCGLAGCGRVLAYSSVWNVIVVGKWGKSRQCFCFCLMLACEVAWGALCLFEFLDLTAHLLEMIAIYILFFKDSGMFRNAAVDGDRIVCHSRFDVSGFRAFTMSPDTRRLWTIALSANFLVLASAIPLIFWSVWSS